MATLLKGAAVTAAMGETIRAETEKLKALGIQPQMAVVRCGNRADDLSYEAGILKKFAGLGIDVCVVELPEAVPQEVFLKTLHTLNGDEGVHGVLIFRPLPPQLSEEKAQTVLLPSKDADCMTTVNLAKVFSGDATGFAPCTPEAVLALLHHYQIPLSGKKVVLIGRSLVVGRPLAMMLLSENATVTICHTRTQNLPETVRQADIVIAAAGKAKMVTADFLSQGQVVIDVGINLDESGKLCGDVDFATAESIVSQITPVPGGVGAVTTSCLAMHIVRAAQK